MANIEVQINATQLKQSPSPHTSYNISVTATSSTQTTSSHSWKRYSEFLELHTVLSRDALVPPFPFPKKSSILEWGFGVDNTELRRALLVNYLNGILQSENKKWSEHPSFIEFLGLDKIVEKPEPIKAKETKPNLKPSRTNPIKSQIQQNLLFTPTQTSRSFGVTIDPHATPQTLVEQQNSIIRNQDETLCLLSTVIYKQKEIGTTLGREIIHQNELLDDVNEKVLVMKTKSNRASKMMDKVVKG